MAKIIINEFYRGGTLTAGDEFIELLLVEDLTAVQLESFFVGDSTGAKASKFSAYDFTNMSSIASTFRAGTIITVGGTTAFNQDTSYNPTSGDWNISLNAGGSFLPNANSGNNGDIAGDDIVWVDTANTGTTISPDGFAVDIGTATGAFTSAVNVNFGASTNNTGYALNSDFANATNIVNWTTGIAFASTTPGQPNGGNNTTFINNLRSSVVTPAGVTIIQSNGNTSVSEAGQTTDTYTIALNTIPVSAVTVAIAADGQSQISTDGTNFSNTVNVVLNSTNPTTISVRAVDDAVVETSPHIGIITHSITSSDPNYSNSLTPISNINVNITDNDAPPVRIRDIQGTAHISPLRGQSVSNVAGIVTAVTSNGFYLQDPNPDDNDATSEGIFVFTASPPPVAVGTSVLVNGTVTEFRPGGSASGNLTTTQISSPTITTVSTGNALPAPIILGNGGRAIPTQIISNDAANGNVENSGTVFDPAQDGIDFYESLEGMRVQVNNAVAVGPTNNFGEIAVLADNGANASVRTSRGGIVIQPGDFNPERIIIDDAIVANEPQVNVGDTFNGATVGVIDYSFGNFKLLNTQALPSVVSGGLQREVTNLTPTANQLTVGTFNVENLDPGDGDTKFNSLANAIVNNLKSPDIISLEEIQDNNGPINDSVVDASQTYQKLINAIASAGGPAYEFRQINPLDDTNGGEPGGNIRVGFLFNPNRVSFVNRPGASSTTNTTVSDANGFPLLSDSPGLLDPTNSAFNSSRKPLVGEFIFNGQTVYVIGNHFNSKGGDQPLFGVNQPPALTTEVQRNQQATIVRDFVQSILAIDPHANVVVAGDLNDFQFSNPLSILESAGLTTLIEGLPLNEQYTYIFDGNSQVLDHILVSQNLSKNLDGFDVVHINSEFAEQTSDHDPTVARFNLSPNIINGTPGRDDLLGTSKGDTIIGFQGRDTITTGGNSDRIVYTSIGDGGDIITDFTVGADKLDFSQLLDTFGYNGTNPIADGFLGFEQKGTNAVVLFDPNGFGNDPQRAFVTLENVSVASLNEVNNFVF